MTKTELQQILAAPYVRRAWLDALHAITGNASLFTAVPAEVALGEQAQRMAGAAFELGSFLTDDERLVGFYEVQVLDNVNLERNKVGLRNLLRTVYRDRVDGALVVFVQGEQWRLSFVSDIRINGVSQETAPRRYTYLLGKDVPVRTPTERLFPLTQKKELSLDDLRIAFSAEVLAKEFYRELSDWYFWALSRVRFPLAETTDLSESDSASAQEAQNATGLIRLITRIMFVWFLKEKKLVPAELFEEDEARRMLNSKDKTGSTYYKAILQNLFFATLNTKIGDENRRFVDRQTGVQEYYRYERFFANKARFLELTRNVPFLNGGLFENLDKVALSEGLEVRIDCFSNQIKNEARLVVPDELFFSEEQIVDLSAVYDDKKRAAAPVRGLFRIFARYHFTLEENTPLDEAVALDPELLGRVFENLLAAYNPETRLTARKQTGSFYTPREVVDYMVDECLVAYLKKELLTPSGPTYAELGKAQTNLFGNEAKSGQLSLQQTLHEPAEPEALVEQRLRELLAYDDRQPFAQRPHDVERLVTALESLRVIDPAVGSGAFPMGILQKMVHVLAKLDPENQAWRAAQEAKAREEVRVDLEIAELLRNETAKAAAAKAALDERLREIEAAFDLVGNEKDYARKLFLIQRCVYGVDVQPIAVQIAKLRFFISLTLEQKINEDRPNRGILSLPNLETKFVAADTVLTVQKKGQGEFRSNKVLELEEQLTKVRDRHFAARTPQTKQKYREHDRELREALAAEMVHDGWPDDVARRLAAWNPYDQNRVADFFEPDWMFGLKDGFDIVIGNPPYVQLQKLGEQSKIYDALKYKTFARTGDLYCLFFERGAAMLKPNGTLCYIASNKWMRAGYGLAFRKWLRRHVLHQIVDFGDLKVFEAAAYPAIVLLQKSRPTKRTFMAAKPQHLPQQALGPSLQWFETRLDLLDDANGWTLAAEQGQQLLKQIRNKGIPLGEYVKGAVYYGIKTGLNEAFVVSKETRDRLVAEDPNSAEVLKPFLAGRDVKRYAVNWRGDYLIFARRGIEIERYPAILRYLEKYKAQLMPKPAKWTGEWSGRKPGSYKWFELQDAVGYYEAFEKDKIILPDISLYPNFALDHNRAYLGNTGYIIGVDDFYLLGLLNSKVLHFFYKNLSSEIRGGYLRYIFQYLVQLPIVKATQVDEQTIKKLVTHLLALRPLHETDKDARMGGLYLEQVLDACAYELYFGESVRKHGKAVLAHLAEALAEQPEQPDVADAHALWRRLYDPEHPVRRAVYYIDSVPEVRLIMGKSG